MIPNGDGALYFYRFTDHGRPDVEGMLRIVKSFWRAVELAEQIG
jgi:hypothetical protein